MKKEYDFTNAEQGKFYRPIEELDIPIFKKEASEIKQALKEVNQGKTNDIRKLFNELKNP